MANNDIEELGKIYLERENYHNSFINPIQKRVDATIELQGKIDNFGMSVSFMEQAHKTLNFLNRSTAADIIANNQLGNFVS